MQDVFMKYVFTLSQKMHHYCVVLLYLDIHELIIFD